MGRVTIQQFRAALSGGSDRALPVRAYRELTRRPELAAKMSYGEWPIWNQGAPVANA